MNSAEAKKMIFASIRQNLAASLPFNESHHSHHKSESEDLPDSVINEIPKEILIENFRESLEFVGGEFTAVFNEREAANVLSKIIADKNARNIAFSDSDFVARIVELSESDAEFTINAEASILFESDLGITGAQWAIAETGTLVLKSEDERHRLTSLVPPIHVCILEAGKIRQSLGEVLEILKTDLNSAITFITGASRTSDIELTLAIGVHGPGELHVILIDKKDE